jgi:hypothetical protein
MVSNQNCRGRFVANGEVWLLIVGHFRTRAPRESNQCIRGPGGATDMKRKMSRNKRKQPKSVLRLPDLEVARTSVLQSLSSPDSQRGYRHAIDEFVDWYCSEPRLAFSRTVVVRYRSFLESRLLAPGTINLRLGAVRRLAYEAADCGLLSSDLAAGIRRVKRGQELRGPAWELAYRGARAGTMAGS